MSQLSSVLDIFYHCVIAIQSGKLIRRESRSDKEFHFQNWVRERLDETGLNYDQPGRNTYPDFRLVQPAEGYEVKGLAYPGRVADFDSNSQVPSGNHNGRTVFYIFGRYPEKPDGDTYPVIDLVICHGDFLNADHNYVHKNKSVKGFGTYGDIMIRDRKMYVVPTPFGLAAGIAHAHTLVLPDGFPVSDEFEHVGMLTRKESQNLIVSYQFDLRDNNLVTQTVPNPFAGRDRVFQAWRLRGSPGEPAAMKQINANDIRQLETESEPAE